LIVSVTVPGFSADWPQFLGAARNGVYSGPALSNNWSDAGPSIVWQKKTGEGFSNPVVAHGKVIVFHRLDAEEIVECLDAKTGNTVWKFSYLTKFRDPIHFDNGPRSTPAIVDGKVYSFGAEGLLHCLNLEDG